MKYITRIFSYKTKGVSANDRWSFVLLFFSIAALSIAIITFFETKAYKDTKETYSRVIVIDAGHGGDDPGKISADGILEKDVNLAIAKKLETELLNRGYEVVLTRENDEWLSTPGTSNQKKSDMNNRVEIINNSEALFLISIHQNSFTDSSVKGAQVFYYGVSEEGKGLAKRIQENIKKDVDSENRREIKEGNEYFILRRSNCPGVIVECGFLSNYEETAKLINDSYQQKLAVAIADAIDAKK